MPYKVPIDETQNVIKAIETGMSPKNILTMFNVSSATFYRIKKKVKASVFINANHSEFLFTHERPEDNYGEAF